MRYQGRITDWKDDRGFGFITPNGEGPKVFIHISALGAGQHRPSGGELVTYELVQDEKKGHRAQNVLYVGARSAARRVEHRPFRFPLLLVLLVGGIGAYAWHHFAPVRVEPLPPAETAARPKIDERFRCQGKRFCSEMTSCAEATFYLKNCPGVQIDGDGDGIPCESQWCGR